MICNVHGKEVELVCKQEGKLVCVLCIATTHSGHACITIDKYYESQKDVITKLLQDAKQRAAKLKEGAKNFTNEREALITWQQSITTEINAYFNQVC